ncbi:MAG: hypothetical protein E7648_01350 [Ruminococcaceae bacterium]|nr:hypothetical protein [Oscillospiraceae bacterium]
MKDYNLYITLVCIFVFVLLTAAFSWLITVIGKQQARLITSGLEDETIKASVLKKLNKKKKRSAYGIIDKIITGAVCLVLCAAGIVAIITGVDSNKVVKGAPALKVVASTSMCVKYEGNKYLFNNGLDNQLQMFDLIVLHELPPEDEIELYDIIVYEHINGALYVHRVVRIEEPNEEHPNERHFLMQGDANAFADVYPVKYSQMKSIYRDERMPNIGSLVFFMQSPAGILCILLLVFTLIAMPIIDNLFMKKEYERVKIMVDNGELDEDALTVYRLSKRQKGSDGE